MNLVRRLPSGSQVKREVDLMLDKCSETMTPMHFHIREIIFSTYNKVGKLSVEYVPNYRVSRGTPKHCKRLHTGKHVDENKSFFIIVLLVVSNGKCSKICIALKRLMCFLQFVEICLFARQ